MMQVTTQIQGDDVANSDSYKETYFFIHLWQKKYRDTHSSLIENLETALGLGGAFVRQQGQFLRSSHVRLSGRAEGLEGCPYGGPRAGDEPRYEQRG